ncbi:uncharacterized protein DSM5745_03619 [Aspergillus mulundensis]|uniref:Uncharacterized protein n=1 Tax=Aspergillus mulundensis TaxID=1810919 RepID=A0A3D8SKX7_9EURO|nr:hypothetical protein DSM5745_03619 [Aspergillus mulundensis]RDW86977.1 hypothetical protein DSM5745_03619 [Aspergillus mulundensis]
MCDAFLARLMLPLLLQSLSSGTLTLPSGASAQIDEVDREDLTRLLQPQDRRNLRMLVPSSPKLHLRMPMSMLEVPHHQPILAPMEAPVYPSSIVSVNGIIVSDTSSVNHLNAAPQESPHINGNAIADITPTGAADEMASTLDLASEFSNVTITANNHPALVNGHSPVPRQVGPYEIGPYISQVPEAAGHTFTHPERQTIADLINHLLALRRRTFSPSNESTSEVSSIVAEPDLNGRVTFSENYGSGGSGLW